MEPASISSDSGHLLLSFRFDGDFYVAIDAASHGYSGSADGHVAADNFNQFASDLCVLEEKRKGSAVLSSVIPDVFEIRIESLDNLGHLGASGTLTDVISRNHHGHVVRLDFSFEFSPSVLAAFSNSVAACLVGAG